MSVYNQKCKHVCRKEWLFNDNFLLVSGQRFAMFSTKVAMVALLKNFKFSVCDKTQHPVKFNKSTFLLQSEKGLWVHLESLNP